ncbi:flagellar basal body P-ring formation chaperone FlgA [Pelagibacterium limicola]|uniref:flagellar basal body P-ring formation chaperone FlgA n=1 Tax=Pelagibacterium limicola TaxID=2791022 RepID=UPI001A9B316E|nr:flagellar basal body P-ring formation chaperone FlgA [Pelagibacterium limicola]
MFTARMKRTALTLAFAMLAHAAHAMPILRGDVTIESALVTVGDVFENAGLQAETAIFRAPVPGTSGVVTIDQIRSAVKPLGIDTFETAGLDRIRVTRPGIAIDLPLISGLIEADLLGRGILNGAMNMQIALDAPLPVLTAAATEAPASLVILRYMPGSSTFSARFQVSGHDTPLDVSGQIQIMIEAPHLARTLPAGSILGANDIEMRLVPLTYAENAGLVRVDDIVGKQLQRQTRAGVLIRPNDLAAPELVSRNDMVTVIYRQGPLTLTARGKALNAASMSEPVSVLNPMTRKVLHGVAIDTGVVLISSGNQQIAGL